MNKWRVTKINGSGADWTIASNRTGGFIGMAAERKNALVMAAAPELLRALQHANVAFGGHTDEASIKTLKMIRAAIALTNNGKDGFDYPWA